MPQKLVVGPFNRGLRNDVTAFNVDNESFPRLINAYQWRGRVKRKRGTSRLGRLNRYLGSTDGSGDRTVTILPIPIITGIVTFVIGTDIFIDPGTTANPADQILITNSLGATHTLNRVTGVLTITGSIANTPVYYFPTLPVMGLEDLELSPDLNPGTLGFDTVYSYNILTTFPYNIYDVSFYKNVATATYTNYVQKTTWTPVSWNGRDYQQFWTCNYQGALWATNGVTEPFSPTNIGMQFKPIVATTVTAGGPPATVNLQITAHGLVVGDFVFVNEVVTTTGINWQTGYVTTVTDANNVIVTFPNATIATNGTGGIAQYLTSRSDVTKDCIRFYDGDPTNGNSLTPTLVVGHGWVNFMPPLSQAPFSIADLPPRIYYLVGARMIVNFKDRLLFLGAVVQASTGNPIYLRDTIVYSQNGTPYYTASFTGSVTSAATVFNPILLPENQTSTANSFFEDSTGFGGFLSAGIAEPIVTTSINEDVLIIGFTETQTRLVYTGNDIVPFNLFVINSEYGSASTFSSITMDKAVITRGSRGFLNTSQTECSRIDLEIPDEVFQVKLVDNGSERVCSERDFVNEWIYFTYPSNSRRYKFPGQTLMYNYRDNNWSVFFESYTTYGTFRKRTGFTWATVGTVYPTWREWNDPWNAGTSTLLNPEVIAGNQQGFVVIRDDGTGETESLAIQNISGSTITSPNHCLNNGDYITINGILGTVGNLINGLIFSVMNATTDTFNLNPILMGTGTYLGGGEITRMYVPFIQSKQFPVAWDIGRKTRIGSQQYLLTTTDNSEIQLLIFLSQNADSAYNTGSILPNISNLINSSLVYSTVLYTCTESSNLGLTPANTNLQMISLINDDGTNAVSPQSQIWHRVNTSLIGDTVQVAFTMSDEQMRDEDFKNQFSEIELHGIIMDVSSAGLLA